MKKHYSLFILIVLVLLLTATDLQAQCAMCAASLESSADGGKNTGINSGILYLMLFPYILIGSIAFLWYYSYNKKKEKAAGL